MKIGIDFDNTIVCFDDLFYRAALEKGLIQKTIPVGKDRVRDYLRQTGREKDWTELQGYVYGSLIQEAPMFPGVDHFLKLCKQKEVPLAIISHKTRTPFLGHPYDLHQAAYGWLEKNGFFQEFGFQRSQIFLELTKQEKLNRIAQENCTHFIDDLPEFLMEPSFPVRVQRILFDPQAKTSPPIPLLPVHSWDEIKRVLFACE